MSYQCHAYSSLSRPSRQHPFLRTAPIHPRYQRIEDDVHTGLRCCGNFSQRSVNPSLPLYLLVLIQRPEANQLFLRLRPNMSLPLLFAHENDRRSIDECDYREEEKISQAEALHRPKPLPLWKIILPYLITVTIAVAIGFILGRYHPGLATVPKLEGLRCPNFVLQLPLDSHSTARTTLRTFNYNLTFAKAPSPATNAAWNSLLPRKSYRNVCVRGSDSFESKWRLHQEPHRWSGKNGHFRLPPAALLSTSYPPPLLPPQLTHPT